MMTRPMLLARQPIIVAGILCAIGLLGAACAASADGLIEAQQTIFGMDCAPCAYGTEQGLKKLKGVTAVTVSLNEGKASLKFAPDSETTLEQVREVIRHNGFTPKDAFVTVEGRVAKTGESYELIAGSKVRYTLAAALPAELDALLAHPRLTVQGRVSENDADTLAVSAATTTK